MQSQPSFTELVIYYLPSVEWDRGDTMQSGEARTYDPAPKTSRLDIYHYRLLRNCPDCDPEQLELAWKQWLEWGEFKNGERQRFSLFEANWGWGVSRELYAEIQKGFHGSKNEQEIFEYEWKRQGIKEAASDSTWATWIRVMNYNDFAWHLPKREPLVALYEGRSADHFLGKRLYKSLT